MTLFSHAKRPVHLGGFPLERLARWDRADPAALNPAQPLLFSHENPQALTHAMARFMALFDTVRAGPVVHAQAEIPEDPQDRSDHLKAAGYYFDAAMMGVCALTHAHHLAQPHRNPMIDALRTELEQGQPKTHAAGIDAIYADILDAARSPHGPVTGHSHALVIAIDYTRDPAQGEPGTDWLHGTQAHRAALLANYTAVVLSSYLRMLGHEARAHSACTSEVDLPRLALSAGLAYAEHGVATNPYLGTRFGLAAVTTTLDLAPDRPLLGNGRSRSSHRLGWITGAAAPRRAATAEAFSHREFRKGPYPFERLKRVDTPTTLIDEDRIPRFPKRADFFARALYGDMGKAVQDGAKGGRYVLKSPIGACARRALGALLLLQFGEARGPVVPSDPQTNADNLKAASYYLSCDAVGLSRVPDWAYYSHNSAGEPITPYHANSVNMLLDQGFETMEGASGDDWISVAQSMRAYLRFSLLGGVVAEQIRRMGYSARVHSALDGDVLQPPLLLLSGLGEVSRIGEVILNPYLGPRLKSGSVTTDMPMAHDRPIDFGLQRFCDSCNKCARECPSGAISAGTKRMYNGYEIWKSDAEKCARYRITNTAGGMCGRCMKTCPWNLQGLFAEAPFRWLAMKAPGTAKALARLDDALERGTINPAKTWWWDVELDTSGTRYVRAGATNRRGLSTDLRLRAEDQTLAVYPADVMPLPFPIKQPLNREDGIARYRALLTPEEYRNRLRRGETEGLTPQSRIPGAPPVFPVVVTRRDDLSPDTVRLELQRPDGSPLPPFDAGAHIDVMIAPEYQREYSLAGDPADTSTYVLGIQREGAGRGGSILLHRVFHPGRKVFITPPTNLFPLQETAPFTLLIGGGIGITPMLTMAHRLHALDQDFRLHYLARGTAPFGAEIAASPWADHASVHVKTDGPRVDLATLIPAYAEGARLYTCGGGAFMEAVFDTARAQGWPDEALSREFFAVPEAADYENHAFTLALSSGRTVPVAADETATEALAKAGIIIPTKCSDGICGVCAIGHKSPAEIEHRDYVLSASEREHKIILCCSRAREAGGTISLDL